MIGKLYLVDVKHMNRVPYTVVNKYFIVRSCRNSDSYTRKGWYIMPQLSPSPNLFTLYLDLKQRGEWDIYTFTNVYTPRFLEQMKTDNVMRNTLNNIKAILDTGNDVAFMCYCDSFCHRFILGSEFEKRGYSVINLSEEI